MKNKYSTYSFYCTVSSFVLILITFIWLVIAPSPPLAEFLGITFPYPIGIISFIGLFFSLKGIKEDNTFKKWFGIITNLFFVIILLIVVFE